MILALRTDSPTLTIALFDVEKTTLIQQQSIELGRSMARDSLKHIEAVLRDAAITWHDITGIIIFKGPGSFTGLRIGATIANAIAYAQHIPITGTSGENWQQQGLENLARGKDDKVVMPEYGKPAHITQPRR